MGLEGEFDAPVVLLCKRNMEEDYEVVKQTSICI